jgi:lipoyl synthase
MTSLPIIDLSSSSQTTEEAPQRRLPRWLKRPMPQPGMAFTNEVIQDLRLETVCESRKPPLS